MLNQVNHDAAHYMIQALSLTEAGSDRVKALEDIRYYHKAADVYDLGYGGILVEAFDEDSDGDFYWEGSVLIPSRRDRLIYKSAAYQDEPVQGALFWGWNTDGCMVIPRVLGEWAAECALAHATKMKTVHSPAECRPVSCSVDSDSNSTSANNADKLGKMAVTAPVDQINLPGLTKDKWARQKAAEADMERRDTSWDFPSLIMPGYLQLCPTVYGVNINRIDTMGGPLSLSKCTVEDLCDKKSWEYRPPVVLRAACQIMSDLRHWEYFDKCSTLQCAKHLIAQDFRPVDL